ncbi:hypothetical protein PPERSA_06704 [Pseudocohnilembus persalinus]|uniref:Uncharacterized protein n=1 Tax=Pseudocohnilembus persalinus TaxID=266149 RepID=A0A0V0QRV7_PSEPJ|nr:hypothetical protein PPERSA_06704 [Pseudocohnilembus persalinus]|eukprot:KRX05070.1 hypothetical protein PPERSA_06704 [Pseudocohnilembus persalinus]
MQKESSNLEIINEDFYQDQELLRSQNNLIEKNFDNSKGYINLKQISVIKNSQVKKSTANEKNFDSQNNQQGDISINSFSVSKREDQDYYLNSQADFLTSKNLKTINFSSNINQNIHQQQFLDYSFQNFSEQNDDKNDDKNSDLYNNICVNQDSYEEQSFSPLQQQKRRRKQQKLLYEQKQKQPDRINQIINLQNINKSVDQNINDDKSDELNVINNSKENLDINSQNQNLDFEFQKVVQQQALIEQTILKEKNQREFGQKKQKQPDQINDNQNLQNNNIFIQQNQNSGNMETKNGIKNENKDIELNPEKQKLEEEFQKIIQQQIKIEQIIQKEKNKKEYIKQKQEQEFNKTIQDQQKIYDQIMEQIQKEKDIKMKDQKQNSLNDDKK